LPEELVRIGRVGRPHGLAGAFFVEEPSEDEARLAKGATVYADGLSATVVESKRARGRPVIRLDRRVERGAELTVTRSALPEPGEGSYYVFQLVGLQVVAADGTVLGRVSDVSPGVANDVLELDSGLALPMHEDCVRGVDLETGRIVVASGFSEPG
jgi:16S rRNA processing protein RimM